MAALNILSPELAFLLLACFQAYVTLFLQQPPLLGPLLFTGIWPTYLLRLPNPDKVPIIVSTLQTRKGSLQEVSELSP